MYRIFHLLIFLYVVWPMYSFSLLKYFGLKHDLHTMIYQNHVCSMFSLYKLQSSSPIC